MRTNSHSVGKGALVGAVASVFASYVMDEFQRRVCRLRPGSNKGAKPSTVKAAERVIGREIHGEEKKRAGNAVHYGFGTALGAVYGAIAEVEPQVTAGFGLPFGAAVAVVADEALVPALGLSGSGPSWQSPLAAHAYSLASHMVFGAALEAARRALLRVL